MEKQKSESLHRRSKSRFDFSVLSSNSAVNEMIAYAAKVSGAKVILYAWDDNYSYPYSKSPFLRAVHFFRRKMMRKTAALASDLFVISDIQNVITKRFFQWSVR